MAHQNPLADKAAAKNAATGPVAPRVPGAHPETQFDPVGPEPHSYAAPDARDATLAPPASGEVGDYADEGDAIEPPLGEVQMGGNRNNISSKDQAFPQGRKTMEANRARFKRGPGTESAR
jgi:hypothetical protein